MFEQSGHAHTIADMSFRETLFEQLAGDLEYHPKRAALYLALAVAAFCLWFFSPAENKFTTTPLVFLLGSLSLLLKGVFLLRKSSEGLGMSRQEVDALSSSAKRKALPRLPEQGAQVVQDFGAGSVLLWPLLNMGKDFDSSWIDPPRGWIVLAGSVLFALGWLIRRLTHVNRLHA